VRQMFLSTLELFSRLCLATARLSRTTGQSTFSLPDLPAVPKTPKIPDWLTRIQVVRQAGARTGGHLHDGTPHDAPPRKPVTGTCMASVVDFRRHYTYTTQMMHSCFDTVTRSSVQAMCTLPVCCEHVQYMCRSCQSHFWVSGTVNQGGLKGAGARDFWVDEWCGGRWSTSRSPSLPSKEERRRVSWVDGRAVGVIYQPVSTPRTRGPPCCIQNL
jgi:hypothetical protein